MVEHHAGTDILLENCRTGSNTAVHGRTRSYIRPHTVAQNRFLLHTVAQTTVHGHTRSHKKSRSAGMAYPPEGDFLTVIFDYPMFHHCLLTRVSKVQYNCFDAKSVVSSRSHVSLLQPMFVIIGVLHVKNGFYLV